MDIGERRRPLDGRISLELSTKSIDFRVSTTPSIYGEKAVLRILGKTKASQIPDIEDLYLSRQIYLNMKKLITSPNGVVFITGPTGSGKTTTLFSAIKYINNPELNIMTIEDPIEYRLPGITQIQTNKKIGLDFATVLRSALRQDPDVLLIGEIRDIETAKIATEAALTGHLVLSTLHTNDAIQAVTRLIEIGVEPFIVGPSIIGVIAQRLVRKICEKCKEPYKPSREILDRIFEWEGNENVTFYHGKGCDVCKGIGYKGRIAVHEMVMVNEKLRDMILRKSTNFELKKAALENNFQSMWYDGIKKVFRGLTTLEEVERVTIPDE